ncbi:MAG: hypothetical protein AB7T32_14190 [Dehalococcoidia bacterium]
MYDSGGLERYELPVLSSRRGIIVGLILLTALYAVLYAAAGIERASDGIVITLFSILLLVATSPVLSIHHQAARLIIVAPLCIPWFIAAASASSTTTSLMLGAVGIEVLVFAFLFLQSGTAQVTVRGVQRRRLVMTSVSFDEISGVKRFDSTIGKILRFVGFGSATVELLLYSWKTVHLNIAPEDVDAFIEEVSQEIDPTEQYDLFVAEPVVKTVVIVDGVEQEVKPKRRRGKKAKKLANQQKAATQTPASVR